MAFATLRPRRLVALLLSAALLAGASAVMTPLSSPPPAQALGSLGTVSTGVNPNGIAVNPSGTLAMVANEGDGTVTVIEISATGVLTTVDTVDVGGAPSNVTFTPDGTEAWVATWTGNTVKVIDVATLAVVQTIEAGNGSFDVVFSNDGTTAWVINYIASSIAVVDTDTYSVTTTVGGFAQPQRAVLSADGATLFVAGFGGAAYRLTTATLSWTAELLDGQPSDVALTADGAEVWVTRSSGSAVSILSSATLEPIASVNTTANGVTSIVRSSNGRQMLVSYDGGLDVFDVKSRQLLSTIATGDSGYGITAIPGFNRYLHAQRFTNRVSYLGFETERLAGTDRYRTAVAISKRAFPSGGADVVFVANGEDFPDALSAGPAAGFTDGSLLLTPPSSLPTVVRNEIARLNPGTIYVVGGTGAVSASVFNALKAIQPNTVRLSGADRYATSRAVVSAVWHGENPGRVFIATGRGFPDALSAGAAAAAFGDPVVLVDGLASTIPASTLALIAQLAPDDIYIAGGTGVVRASIEAKLVSIYGDAGVTRLAGTDRYKTSAAINQELLPLHEGTLYATGTSFPDALAGVALAGRLGAPLYLVQRTCVPKPAYQAIWTGQSTRLFLLGGTGALSPAVANLVRC